MSSHSIDEWWKIGFPREIEVTLTTLHSTPTSTTVSYYTHFKIHSGFFAHIVYVYVRHTQVFSNERSSEVWGVSFVHAYSTRYYTHFGLKMGRVYNWLYIFWFEVFCGLNLNFKFGISTHSYYCEHGSNLHTIYLYARRVNVRLFEVFP